MYSYYKTLAGSPLLYIFMSYLYIIVCIFLSPTPSFPLFPSSVENPFWHIILIQKNDLMVEISGSKTDEERR